MSALACWQESRITCGLLVIRPKLCVTTSGNLADSRLGFTYLLPCEDDGLLSLAW
jgi:hypothetical protein